MVINITEKTKQEKVTVSSMAGVVTSERNGHKSEPIRNDSWRRELGEEMESARPVF